jgi:hypothetical protein
VRVPSIRERRTSVLTKKPISGSSARCSRPATGVPIATSSLRLQRATSSANALSSSMKSEAPCARAMARSSATSIVSSARSTLAPAESKRAGRGRSSGSACTAGKSASCAFQ